MRNYLDLLKDILANGLEQDDRTGVGTYSVFGRQLRFDLKDSFPLVTTKKIHFKSVVHELLWFLRGDTNIRYLLENGVHIWSEWPYEDYKKRGSKWSTDFISGNHVGEDITLERFEERIINEDSFSRVYGSIGLGYGKQWRRFGDALIETVDQIDLLIEGLRSNPFGRRHIVSAWNPCDLGAVLLPPCHLMFQCRASIPRDGSAARVAYEELQRQGSHKHAGLLLDLQVYIRSSDTVLGLPFNIASYALLNRLIAKHLAMVPNELVVTLGDAHIYKNHLEAVETQLCRDTLPLPKLEVHGLYDNIWDYKYEDIRLIDYESHPAIKADVAV